LSEGPRLKGKQRRFLKAMATGIDPILQVGKAGVTDDFIKQVDDALEARELIKLRILPSAGDSLESIAREVACRSGAELVQVIGRNFVLYRRSEKKPKLQLP